MATDISQTNHSSRSSGALAAITSGASLIVPVLKRRSLWTWAAAITGGALAYAGIRAVRKSPVRPARAVQFFQQCLNVDCDATELSAMWRNPQVLNRVMRPFGSVIAERPDRLRWTFDIPVHGTLSGDAFKVEERPGELVHWRTAPGSPIEVDEWLLLTPKKHGTRVTLRYRVDSSRLPAGALLRALTSFLKGPSNKAIRMLLHNLKSIAESHGQVKAA